jgi:hypothetical protein
LTFRLKPLETCQLVPCSIGSGRGWAAPGLVYTAYTGLAYTGLVYKGLALPRGSQPRPSPQSSEYGTHNTFKA